MISFFTIYLLLYKSLGAWSWPARKTGETFAATLGAFGERTLQIHATSLLKDWRVFEKVAATSGASKLAPTRKATIFGRDPPN
ncbi:hypothetical protein COY52_05185 [Candidatus Desantisbacteria bacterium CG_4_10_14_0_8_um_filter_48_22]|uniref:Uncharacterized protein n=1 Tax=Candidatus Desantisbacteria bacterium CG_4_10_14_0_8_um_filter_48_22 TaxID=1974543 RepID=A0A2M7SCF6_9BACT|nr:MAG: hypothetical protein AUJ67_02075 [Candidatus Desantisbacteria bacterium CG1_02_49_89]PIV55155.1 MAG: hypothetical protein COS16_08090 [Candidatus Desantisbacteria bacterium CG02_land_8_20_14_3_00_49_13]PIZ17150.1 MAG: hypothetical protein COY52_05185 [Candidatus Desantisbacteria bacterium CG_4_10_14_0_8_um_filter_48_22]PJB27715.1 MAG: hypothetical protein CO111_03735 [Candidatus Desantisbacteria bacterium CG_4_9_14_3_um_filter_50_7]